ncbi:MAG: F0F1 ATP synthase subunit beta, partial [Candidatus Limnocylindrus sp.]
MANAGTKSAGAVGTVVQVTGPVVDIEFAARELPAIYNAVRVDRADGSLVAEVLLNLNN